jgi:hypothetical protein
MSLKERHGVGHTTSGVDQNVAVDEQVSHCVAPILDSCST